MKANIHPTYYKDAVVTCSCGATFTTGSSMEAVQVDICSACHPFFTGEMRFVDVQGRVEKFQAKMQQATTYKKTKKQKGTKNQDAPKSLKEMLSSMKATPDTKK